MDALGIDQSVTVEGLRLRGLGVQARVQGLGLYSQEIGLSYSVPNHASSCLGLEVQMFMELNQSSATNLRNRLTALDARPSMIRTRVFKGQSAALVLAVSMPH